MTRRRELPYNLWSEARKVKHRAKVARWRRHNPDKARAQHYRYVTKHRAALLEKGRRYNATHRQQRRDAERARRRRLRFPPNDHQRPIRNARQRRSPTNAP